MTFTLKNCSNKSQLPGSYCVNIWKMWGVFVVFRWAACLQTAQGGEMREEGETFHQPWALMTSSRCFLTAVQRLCGRGAFLLSLGLVPGWQSMSLCLFCGRLFRRSPPFYWRKWYLEAQTGCPADWPGLWTVPSPPPTSPPRLHSSSMPPPLLPSALFSQRKIA